MNVELHENPNNDRDRPRDPALGEFLRRHGPDGPSATLDQAILAAAQAVLIPPPVKRWSWQRWRTPLATAATLTLALALGLTIDRQPSLTVETATPAKPAEPDASPATSVRTEAPKAVIAPPSAEAPSRREAKVAGANGRPAPSLVPSVSAEPPALQAKRSAPVPVSPPAARDVAKAHDKESIKAIEIAPASRAENEARAASKRLAPAAVPLAEQAPAADATAGQLVPAPEVWLNEIRRLRQEGHPEEAARQLAEFRRRYPDYPLPENF